MCFPYSVNTNFYLGKQRPEPGAADRLGRTDVGWKEDTGFTTNNDRFVQQADNPVRFVTHYDTRSVDSCSPQAPPLLYVVVAGYLWSIIRKKLDCFVGKLAAVAIRGTQIYT